MVTNVGVSGMDTKYKYAFINQLFEKIGQNCWHLNLIKGPQAA